MAENSSFRRRYSTLLKKAKELSVLCEAEVAIFTLKADGRHLQYSTTTVEQTLARYNHKDKDKKKIGGGKEERKLREESSRVGGLKARQAALISEINRRNGTELGGLSKEEICVLEEQLIVAILSVKNKKEELLRRTLVQGRKSSVPQTQNLLRGLEMMTPLGENSRAGSL